MKITKTRIKEIIREEIKLAKGRALIVRIETSYTTDEMSPKDLQIIAREVHAALIPVLDKITKKLGVIAGTADISLKKPTKQSGR